MMHAIDLASLAEEGEAIAFGSTSRIVSGTLAVSSLCILISSMFRMRPCRSVNLPWR
jgi:hypothetical protein